MLLFFFPAAATETLEVRGGTQWSRRSKGGNNGLGCDGDSVWKGKMPPHLIQPSL